MNSPVRGGIGVLALAALLALAGCEGASSGRERASPAQPLAPDAYEPNDSQSQAAPIELDFETSDLTLHEATDEDYFRFTLAAEAGVSVVARFDRAGASTGIQLLNDFGLPLATAHVDAGEARLDSSLNAETYVLRVECGSAMTTPYSLSIRAGSPPVPQPDPFEPNNSPGACHGIGDLNAIAAFPQFEAQGLTIHQAGDLDYFCFSLSASSTVVISMDFDLTGGSLSLALYDAALSPVATGAAVTNGLQAMASLSPGDYVIEIAGIGAATNTYDFVVSLALAPDSFEYNDDPMTCAWILLPHVSTNLTIHSPIDEDWFCFSLSSSQALWSLRADILFVHASGDLDLELYDSTVTLLAESKSADDNESIQIDLLPGDYFLRVFSPGEMNIYDLNVSAQ